MPTFLSILSKINSISEIAGVYSDLIAFNSIQDQRKGLALSKSPGPRTFNSIQDQQGLGRLVKKNEITNFQFYPRSTRTQHRGHDVREITFNSIQDQLKTYILLLLLLYSYYLINFSYLQSVSPPNSFQYKIL